MKKRIFTMFIALICLLPFTACGKNTVNENGSQSESRSEYSSENQSESRSELSSENQSESGSYGELDDELESLGELGSVIDME